MIPHLGLFVLVAIVKAYGVDPSWLFYGVYDSGTHSASLDGTGAVYALQIVVAAWKDLDRLVERSSRFPSGQFAPVTSIRAR